MSSTTPRARDDADPPLEREMTAVVTQRRPATVEDSALAATRDIDVEGVTHWFGEDRTVTPVVKDITFAVPHRQFVALVGASGCGKTTILNMIAGLIPPTEGRVQVKGKDVDGAHPDLGYMFARDALLPWRTAVSNAAFALELKRVPKKEREAVALRELKKVGLEGAERKYRIQLSQGMRQRVALARTLAADPAIFLLDEPFAALDAITRARLADDFVALLQGSAKTVVLVTHDLDEAITLADRIIVFGQGPGRIIFDETVNIPRPRDRVELVDNPEYRRLHREIQHSLV